MAARFGLKILPAPLLWTYNSGIAITDKSVIPAVTYLDAAGSPTEYAAGDGAEVSAFEI